MSQFKRQGIAITFTILAFITTLVIRIPIPATTGYFNIGDVFVILAGLWLGPVSGLFVGAIGPAIADAIGYPQFIPATIVVKALEGFVAGVIARKNASPVRAGIAAGSAALVMVAGYFAFEAFVYPAFGHIVPFFAVTNLGQALEEVLPNAFQGLIGASVGFGLWRAMPKPRRDNSSGESAS